MVLSAASAAIIVWMIRQFWYEARMGEARTRAERIVQMARDEAARVAEIAREQALIEVRRTALAEQEAAEAALEVQRRAVQRERERLEAREIDLASRIDVLERKAAHVDRRADELIARDKTLAAREEELLLLQEERVRRLEEVSEMGRGEATKELRLSVVKQARADARREANRIVQAAKGDASREARRILAAAIQLNATPLVNEAAVTVVELKNDDMKGRIIGREGRNIRAFESETGVDLIIDDTPCRVFLSSFNPEIREIARVALEELLADGRIHPARIEDVVRAARSEFTARVRELGEMAAFEAEVYGLADDLVLLLGRLSFCSLGGQNALQHCIEVSRMAAFMARTIGADEVLARRAGLLHDIGWAKSIDTSGDRRRATIDALTRGGEAEVVRETILGMRQGVTAPRVEAVLVDTANNISKSRPGARREQLRRHVRRLEAMEAIAAELPGVERVNAIQAGRELRVIVDPGEIDDAGAYELSTQVSRKIEKELRYSGSIRVTVIRQSRATEIAH